jgi:hypothetical protein
VSTTESAARPAAPTPPNTHRTLKRVALIVGGLLFAAFWAWALFFASKTPVNQFDDREWTARAEAICVSAEAQRLALADFREMESAPAELVRERADIVDRATDVIEAMLDDVVATTPADAKGREIVPMWEAEYRIYIDNRRDFADDLRRTGENLPFYESTEQGIPVSERLETFAADNDMSSCAPPRDLTR